MKHLRTSLLALVVLSMLTGLLYPLVVTGIAQLLFPRRVNGSLVSQGGRVAGSEVIGQCFVSPAYFLSRPSACNWDAANSGASNLGPTNPKLLDLVRARVDSVRAENGLTPDARVPADLVLASASGLDPHVSPASALLQVPRVARARGLDSVTVRSLVERHVERPFLGVFGPSRVNVLRLNLALDSLAPAPTP
jgi:potassium-transporting ATPase KdpC subunit